ncbi:glycosyltransferase family 8 protein [Peniophora sp. CONT]|nr:glycosyltransferase family 8 protein [Peniophora sp. CONT]
MPANAAWVTLLTKEAYIPGALVVAQGFKDVGSVYPFVCMVTDTLSEDARQVLRRHGVVVRDIDPLLPLSDAHTLNAHDSRFADTWTKLRAFGLVEFERVALMDCDMIVMRNMDELMDLELPEGGIAAAPVCACNPRKLPHYPKDWVPENCAYTPLTHPGAITTPTPITTDSPRPHTLLNSGLVVLHPSTELEAEIVNFVHTSPLVPTFSFPDQDLLSAFFAGRWRPLPWVYNALKTLRVIHTPLWRDEEIRCLHYILHDKPWHARVGAIPEYEEMNKWWWDRFERLVEELDQSDALAKQVVVANVAAPL